MLTNFKVGILGGDARQIQVIKKLCESDATVYLVGFDELEEQIPGSIKTNMENIDAEELDAVLLPVRGTDHEGYLDSHFSDYSPQLTEEWAENLKPSTLVFTGITNNYLTTLCDKHNLNLIPLFNRDDIAIYNSIPTVEGTVMMAIQYTDFTIHDSDVVVLGFGRTGITLARTFKALGARVKVGARKPSDLARIYEMGFEPFETKTVNEHVSDCNILLNTIPAPVVNVKVIQNMPQDGIIIDLASKPGGTDFRYAKKRGVKAILAPSIPNMVAPKTAGDILASVIVQILNEQGERGSY
ncbi:dipicolinic acid synthetase subunit A [Salinibacillus xinjiangensis]|uniref:Dipicolinic acid synthetase subunit A n=1 Tax=Salinibacillus xinjiangensis TaxID=1229268 RepID=A0A6G1X2Y5_9BACI|nr:dipicolinic acid synthetase subunit A [Salinibacillus xinjiangensis]MRG85347.1 dipicolinic acid synthetase subunit A [Salinibacillus xinjiangensis]